MVCVLQLKKMDQDDISNQLSKLISKNLDTIEKQRDDYKQKVSILKLDMIIAQNELRKSHSFKQQCRLLSQDYTLLFCATFVFVPIRSNFGLEMYKMCCLCVELKI